jgi:hypothetical protein
MPVRVTISSLLYVTRGNLCLCLTKHQAMKTYWERGVTAPRILKLDTRWRWAVSFTPQQLYVREKNTRCLLDRRLGERQSRSGRSGEEKNFHLLPAPNLNAVSPTSYIYLSPHFLIFCCVLSMSKVHALTFNSCPFWTWGHWVSFLASGRSAMLERHVK